MKTITISTQILTGNLGDGWNDQYEAAQALAAYTEKTWISDLADLVDDSYEVVFDIEVQRASGAARDVSVDTSPYDDETYDLIQKIESSLTDENCIWEQFCASLEAAAHFSE